MSQVRSFKKDFPIPEFATPESLVRVCEDDHDVNIRRRRQVSVIGEPVCRTGSISSAEAWYTAGFLNHPLSRRLSGLPDPHCHLVVFFALLRAPP